MPYRTPKGKFVARSNPIAVASKVNARNAAQRAREAQRDMVNRRSHGYRGPLTRAELVRLWTPVQRSGCSHQWASRAMT